MVRYLIKRDLIVLTLMGITDVPLLLSFYRSKLSLLLTISHSRTGANQVMTAGLFETVRESGLFAVDPDLGLGKQRRRYPTTGTNNRRY